jgi:hypothetical protein
MSKLTGSMASYRSDVRIAMLSAVDRRIVSMKPQEVSSTIYGMGRLGVLWKDPLPSAPTVAATTVAVAAVSSMKTMKETPPTIGSRRVGATTTTAATTRGSRKSTDAPPPPPLLPPPTAATTRRSNMEITITRQVHNMTEQGLSNVIFGLHLMGAQWHELSHPLRAAIEESMKMKLMQRPPTLLLRSTSSHSQSQQQHHSLTVLTPYGVSNTLYGLAMIGVNWCNISPSYQRRLETLAADYMPKMNEQGLANTIYS